MGPSYMYPPNVQYAFQKISDDIRERISQLVPNSHLEEQFSQDRMGENMTYKFTVVENIDDEYCDVGKVNITMGGADFNLYGRPLEQRELLKREFSSKNFNAKFDAYQKEYHAIQREIYQKAKKLPSLEEISKVGTYVKRLNKRFELGTYLTYATIRDGWVSEYLEDGLSEGDLSEIKTVLEEVIKEKDPEILTLEEKLRPGKKR